MHRLTTYWKESSLLLGTCAQPGLGLSDADRWRLVSEVDTVIHCAASISFFEHIHRLLEQNYEVIMLAPVAEQRCHCGDMLPKCHNQSCHLMDCRLTVSACLFAPGHTQDS